MASLPQGILLTSLLSLMTLVLPSWSSSEAMTNHVSGPRDNSLSNFRSKLSSATSKDRKSDWHAAAVVGTSTADREKTFPASWTPACRNYSCPSPRLDQESGAPANRPYGPLGPADNPRPGVVELMRFVSEELSGLRNALQHLRLDGQAVHRQVKRLHRARCGAARRARRRTKWTRMDGQRHQNTGVQFNSCNKLL